jgi:hypothetical protein
MRAGGVMTDLLQGMTQAKWDALPLPARERIRDLSGLSPQLVGLEGWRVEVTDDGGNKWRFIVGRSTGWRPCHLEISRRSVHGGFPARREYAAVRKLYKAR